MAAETVAYVASRSSALAAFFTLASLRVAAGVLAGAPPRRLFGAMALFLLALATKEEAAALPLLLLLLDYFFVAGQELGALKRRLWIHACFFAVIPLGLAARRLATGSWLPPPAMDPGLYLLTQWAAFPLYFVRALVPIDPSLYRNHPPASWPPRCGDGGARGADSGNGHLGRRPAAAVARMVIRGGVPGRRAAPVLVDRLAQRDGGRPSGLSRQLRRGVRARGSSSAGWVACASAWWCSPCSRHAACRTSGCSAIPSAPGRTPCARAPNAPDALSALAESYAERSDPRAERLFLRLTGSPPRTTATGRTSASTTASTGGRPRRSGRCGRPSSATRARRPYATTSDKCSRGSGGTTRRRWSSRPRSRPSRPSPRRTRTSRRWRSARETPNGRESCSTPGPDSRASAEEAAAFARVRARLP